jgi:hypothetical protein
MDSPFRISEEIDLLEFDLPPDRVLPPSSRFVLRVLVCRKAGRPEGRRVTPSLRRRLLAGIVHAWELL